jgi:hypothetical protein
MDDDGCGIGRVDMIDVRQGTSLGGDHRPIAHGVEGVLHICGSQELPVMKMNAGAQMEAIGQKIGSVPAGSDPGLQVEVSILAYQAIEDQAVYVFRLSIDTDARIKAGGAALNQHRHRLRRLLFAFASGERHQHA